MSYFKIALPPGGTCLATLVHIEIFCGCQAYIHLARCRIILVFAGICWGGPTKPVASFRFQIPARNLSLWWEPPESVCMAILNQLTRGRKVFCKRVFRTGVIPTHGHSRNGVRFPPVSHNQYRFHFSHSMSSSPKTLKCRISIDFISVHNCFHSYLPYFHSDVKIDSKYKWEKKSWNTIHGSLQSNLMWR